MANVNVGGGNPAQATITSPGNYTLRIADGTSNPQVTFVGPGNYTLSNVSGQVASYTVVASGGANLSVNGLESGSSIANLQVAGASTINVRPGVSSSSIINASFSGTGGGTLSIDPRVVSSLSSTPIVSGFTANDHIELGGTSTDGNTYTTSFNAANNNLTLLRNGVADGSVHLVGSYTAANFAIGRDSSGNVEINFACFLRGTRIATPTGSRAVEELRIGDPITLASGGTRPVRWIGRRAYNGLFARRNPDVLPVCFKPGSLGDAVPARDLYVTPKHAMLVDGHLIHATELVNGRSIVQLDEPMSVEYFHVELEGGHALILAEGAATESYVPCDNRATFQNADEFAALYPDDAAPSWAFCLPLIEAGPIADAARAALAARAGLPGEQAGPRGELLGHLDHVGPDVVSGWALDGAARDVPLRVEILEDGVCLASVVADRYRPDLARAGIGFGRHGFRVAIPPAADGQARRIVVRNADTGAILPGSHSDAEAARRIAA